MADDGVQRQVLSIPDRRPIGLTTYDAKDPDSNYPRSGRGGAPDPSEVHPIRHRGGQQLFDQASTRTSRPCSCPSPSSDDARGRVEPPVTATT